MNDKKKEWIERSIKSSEKALTELDKVINQDIELDQLEPEKAKQAVQGKVEAINGTMLIIQKIDELNKMLNPDEQDTTESKGKTKRVASVEGRIDGR